MSGLSRLKKAEKNRDDIIHAIKTLNRYRDTVTAFCPVDTPDRKKPADVRHIDRAIRDLTRIDEELRNGKLEGEPNPREGTDMATLRANGKAVAKLEKAVELSGGTRAHSTIAVMSNGKVLEKVKYTHCLGAGKNMGYGGWCDGWKVRCTLKKVPLGAGKTTMRTATMTAAEFVKRFTDAGWTKVAV